MSLVTKAFRRWFGDSKVVDARGEPLVVYHGAPDVRGIFAGGFKRSSMRGDVFFATDDPRTAETYTDPHRAWDYQNAEPGVIPLYLRIENPLVIDAGFQHWRGTEHVIEQARQAGHDGVVIENTIDHYASDRKAKPRREDACTVFAFFSPTQVKSALTGPMKARDPNRWHVSTSQPLDFTGPNDGTFDLDDADLRSNPRPDGEAIAAWCDSNESYAVLDRTASAGSSWIAGACVLLAKALRKRYPEAKLVGIETDGRIQHVGTRIGETVYDALGEHDPHTWVRDWLTYEQLPARTLARVVGLTGVPRSAMPDAESPATPADVALVSRSLP